MLRPFEKPDYPLLISWINSEKLNRLWGSTTYSFPLTKQSIAQHCSKAEISAFLFLVEGKEAGFAELCRVSQGHYRICRVFIADKYRGKGFSEVMLTELICLAENEYNCSELSLRVFAHNRAAVACYHSLGFVITSTEKGVLMLEGEQWDLLLMHKYLKSG
ncbi:GNAT family N-acetyltransferase [Vibrio sp. SCSIO 43137]|uniref:GNAT family N-acetyltransferase n=1 Tax=Vibrio sp. SCSIO 43137 TaxID=3021011 RepID=UPI0023080D80|nr:GNAT family protein [Vibrio sp. SCSIO 43137]WCE30623.1 GNAT family protein [Vibrio sp. SCSIO 43137]